MHRCMTRPPGQVKNRDMALATALIQRQTLKLNPRQFAI